MDYENTYQISHLRQCLLYHLIHCILCFPIYYHQNSNNDVNFIQPNDASGATQSLKVVASSGSLNPGDTLGAGVVNSSHADAEYPHDDANAEYNGEVIFFENRRPFNRATSQKEEVKLIIQL